ncbi:MAG: hypothetical protein M1816_007892, partial [Peltula sp. TS41687]
STAIQLMPKTFTSLEEFIMQDILSEVRRSPELVRCSPDDINLAYNWTEKDGLIYLSTTASHARTTQGLVQRFKPAPVNGSITVFLAYETLDEEAQAAYYQGASDIDEVPVHARAKSKKHELDQSDEKKTDKTTQKLTFRPSKLPPQETDKLPSRGHA